MSASNPEQQPEPLIELRGLLVGVRWRRRIWLTAAVIGLLLGAAFAVAAPPAPTAEVRILIAHENDSPSDSTGLMQTELAVLETTQVAADALKRVGADEKPEAFLDEYKGTAVTGNVMEIAVEATTEEEALARAQAVADAYIANHIGRVRSTAEAEAASLNEQREKAEKALLDLDAAIASLRGTPEADAMFSRRADLTDQITQLRERADVAGAELPRVEAGTRIVDEPRITTESVTTTLVTYAALGLVLGFGAGIAVAATASVVHDKPVLREEISRHLGASVIGQLRRPPLRPLQRLHRGPATRERVRVARMLVRGLYLDTGAVSILELGCPRSAAQLAMDIAEELSIDRPVVVTDGLAGNHLTKLARKAKGAVRASAVSDAPPAIPVQSGAEKHRIGVGSVAPGANWLDIPALGPEAILVVQAGYADTSWLHAVSRKLADFGIPVIGIVLVHPDPRDRTDGTFWSALRDRSLPAGTSALDTRATAPNNVEVP